MFTHPGLTFRMLQSLDEFYVRNITKRFFVIIWQYSTATALKSPLHGDLEPHLET
jgi:hypothetical protein